MKDTFYFLIVIALGLMTCVGDNSGPSAAVTSKPKSNPKMLARAAAIGKVPTSIGLNFSSGYWHIASGFNIDTLGDFRRWDGTWLQLKLDHELVWGKNEEELGRGAWGWNEPLEQITFISDTAKDFFIGEWQTKSKGDVYVLIGNTPQNPRSTQFKLSRRNAKTVTR